MFIASFASGPWQGNCYVVGNDDTLDCVVIDPGVNASEVVENTLKEYGWHLVGVVCTHGHVDHIADAAKLANAHGVSMWLHSGDDYMLTDPVAGLGEGTEGLLMQVLGSTSLPEPESRERLDELDVLEIAGLHFEVLPAPGHSPGCCLLSTADEEGPIVFCGDVVFAGSIGRVDLPGGDHATMTRTLAEVVLPLPDSARLLPGHGGPTTMARERVANPYLQPNYLRY